MRSWWLLLLAFAAKLPADMLDGLKAFEENRFVEARDQFTALLPVGNQMAAFNLGVMNIKGQGASVDVSKAAALFKYSGTLGHPDATSIAETLYQQMTAEEQEAANRILEKLLQEQYIPTLVNDDDIERLKPIASRKGLILKEPIYPVQAAKQGISGYVVLRALVDKAGNVQVAESILSYPEKVFERAAIAAMKKWQYEPADEITEVRVQLDFSLQGEGGASGDFARLIRKFDIWRNAVVGAPVYQEAVGNILQAVNSGSSVIVKADRARPLNAEAPDFKYLKSKLALKFEHEGFAGNVEVKTDKNGIIVEIITRRFLRQINADDLLGKQITGVNSAGLFRIASPLSNARYNPLSIKPIIYVPANYTAYFWWEEAARGGYLPLQRLLASMNKNWENYLLSKSDPETMAWTGTRLLLEGQREQGMALLEQAIAKNYQPAKEMKKQFM